MLGTVGERRMDGGEEEEQVTKEEITENPPHPPKLTRLLWVSGKQGHCEHLVPVPVFHCCKETLGPQKC